MKISKHAYMILVHEKPEVFKKLIESIDDKRNDIFVHLDIKANLREFITKTNYSNLIFIDQRIDCRWGDFSLVEAEFNLFKAASQKESYSYYHLISGVDYPLKSQDYIHDFCTRHNGKEFIGFAQNVSSDELKWRSQHFFIFSKSFRTKSLIKRILRALFSRVQSIIGYRRSKLIIKKGAQWCSLTNEFVKYLLDHKAEIKKDFNHTYCPDELVIQTYCWNSVFRNNIYNSENEFDGCLRYIPWVNGTLMRFSKSDFVEMKSNDHLFGRKFDIDDIYEWERIKQL